MAPLEQKPEIVSTGVEDHIPFLDHIRGFAVLFVLVYHALGASYGVELQWHGYFRDLAALPKTYLALLPLSMGWSGVAIFFVVSGFCVHLSYERSKRKGFKVFFARRFFRIYPPYILAFCFFAFLFPLTRLKADFADNLAQFVSHFFLFHNATEHLYFGVNGSFWSIVVEVQLYLIYPILLLIAKRFGWGKALLFTGIVEISLRLLGSFYYLPNFVGGGSPFYYWFSWSIGAKLADDYLNKRPFSFIVGCPAWIWIFLAVLAHFFHPLAAFSFVFASLATMKVIAICITPGFHMQIPRMLGGFLQKAGIISYSIYLLHQPFLYSFAQTLTFTSSKYRIHTLLIFLCSLTFSGLIVFGSWVFYRCVEKPSIGFGKWFIRKKLSPPLATPSPVAFD